MIFPAWPCRWRILLIVEIIAAGLPFGVFLFFTGSPIWIPIVCTLLFGLILRFAWSAWHGGCLGVATSFLAGVLLNAGATRGLFTLTNNDWMPVIIPEEAAIGFTYGNTVMYCVDTVTGVDYCCTDVLDPDAGACRPDMLTDEGKAATDDFSRLIDHGNHWILPAAPGEVADIYHYFFSFFEGDGQTSYLLTTDGRVWRWNDWYNSFAMIWVVIAGIWGGAAGLIYYGIRSWFYSRNYRKQFGSAPAADERVTPDIHSPAYVRDLFNRMSASYGLVNAVSSLGFAMRWRRQCVAKASISPGGVVHDWMTGMGECWPSIMDRLGADGRLVAVDLSPVMLVSARTRRQRWAGQKIDVVEGDVLSGELPAGSADVVVSAFGVKTFSAAQRAAFAAELKRVLKPGGSFSLVEISIPPNPALRVLYRFYIGRMIPLIGRLFLGDPETYRMLGVYTELFWNCLLLQRDLQAVGLEVQAHDYFFGCATGLSGRRP